MTNNERSYRAYTDYHRRMYGALPKPDVNWRKVTVLALAWIIVIAYIFA